MHIEKNSLALRIRHALARVLILVLLAGVWSVPAYAGAATITEPAESGSALAEKKRLEQIPAGTSGSTWKKVGCSRSLADFAVIHQHPKLPTGCEVTSLTMVLNYYGFPANKLDIADNYLPKGPIGSTDFRKAFLGDPRNSWSRGCYAPAIVKTANSYLATQKSKMKAVDISGRELTSLSAYTNANIPVMVWGTIDCRKPYVSATWYINGEKLNWVSPEHCMVLLGFPNGRVKVADPDSGNIRLYDLNLFRSRYNALHKQGVIIK